MARLSAGSDNTNPAEEPGANGAAGKGRIVPVAMMSVAIAVAGYFVGGGASSSSSTSPVETVVVVTTEPVVERVVTLDPVNVNLADGRYLRVGIAMGIAHSEDELLEAAAGAETATTEPAAPAADLVLSTFAGKTFEQLASAAGRDEARAAIQDGLREFYGEEVIAVFFTEFVMQ